jgi:iron(III) transport system ATP-binding protein
MTGPDDRQTRDARTTPDAGSTADPRAVRSAGEPGPREYTDAGSVGAIGTALRVVGVRKAFGPVIAVDSVDLELRLGEMLAVLGPSGCGKTTLLRLIAGFERPDAGSVELAGRRIASPEAMVPPERRRVGMVFQDFALFPHLSVRDNVAYGLRADPDRRLRADELLELVGLAGAAEQRPHELSGGMQQRVALARALAPRPSVVLLDEPFGSLDLALRTQLRGEVREILRRASASAIFVTHDQDEALTLADRLAVMVRGRIEQVDRPEIIYGEPASPFVATFVGVANLVPADCDAGVGRTRVGAVRLVGPGRETRGHGLVVVRPEHLDLDQSSGDEGASAGGLAWRVVGRRFTGSEILLELAGPDGERLWAEAGEGIRRIRVGDAVRVRLRDVETVAFPGGRAGA